MFFSEFPILLEDLTISPHQLLLSGDFNFHVDDTSNLNAMTFLDLITSADLRQHVNGATRHLDHTLDFLITRLDDKLISQVRTLPELLSDHVVSCDINLPRPPASRRSVSYRKTRDIDLQSFRSNIKNLCRTMPHHLTFYSSHRKNYYGTFYSRICLWITARAFFTAYPPTG